MLTLFERALMAHLVADWLLQTNWMATNKTNLRHPAGWVHAGIHAICLGLALGPVGGVVLGGIHLVLDTRAPLAWWIRVFNRCLGGTGAVVISRTLERKSLDTTPDFLRVCLCDTTT